MNFINSGLSEKYASNVKAHITIKYPHDEYNNYFITHISSKEPLAQQISILLLMKYFFTWYLRELCNFLQIQRATAWAYNNLRDKNHKHYLYSNNIMCNNNVFYTLRDGKYGERIFKKGELKPHYNKFYFDWVFASVWTYFSFIPNACFRNIFYSALMTFRVFLSIWIRLI